MPVRRNAVIHTPEEIVRIRHAAQLTAQVRDEVARLAVPGMTTKELDDLAGSLIAATGGESAFLGYAGYPGNICISVNDEVVHGIGRPDRVLLPTDIVSIDLGVRIDGACGDTALTFGLGAPLSPAVKNLLEATRRALSAGIQAAQAGNFVRDISAAVEAVGRRARVGIVREYVGHGCGIKLHEPPEVPNFTSSMRGPQLEPGMVLAIEPMFNQGTGKVTTDRVDGWTVRTFDGLPSAHFEHMVLITEKEPEILTWPKTM